MGKRNRPSLGRKKSERGLDQFDTPPIALKTLFMHEPLLADVTTVCEPFAGRGNLVVLMRLYGIDVYASDIEDRGCPGSEILDFLRMKHRPPECHTLISNPAFYIAMDSLEHAWRLGFRLVIFLLEPSFLHTAERLERLHPRGHLRRYYPIAERLQGMHDAAYLAKGGKKGSQPRMHCWYVFDRNYCGKPEIIPISIDDPGLRMPWLSGGIANCCEQCRKPYQPQRSSSRFCSGTCRLRAHRKKVSVSVSVTEEFRYVLHDDVPRFTAEGWQATPALDGTHHGEYSVLMRRVEH